MAPSPVFSLPTLPNVLPGSVAKLRKWETVDWIKKEVSTETKEINMGNKYMKEHDVSRP